MLIYNGQVIAGGGTIVMPMTRAEYEANKAVLDTADVWIDLTDEPDQVAEADQIAYSVGGVQKGMGYIGDIATKAVAKVEPSDTALYLHEVGEYFINKDGNACKVDTQIPVGGAITLGANCHVVDGVANDINSKLVKYKDLTHSASNSDTSAYYATLSSDIRTAIGSPNATILSATVVDFGSFSTQADKVLPNVVLTSDNSSAITFKTGNTFTSVTVKVRYAYID